MIMIRITGGDVIKVRDFFQDTHGESYSLKTVESNHNEEISGKFVMDGTYMDEGSPIRADIIQEQAMVMVILDFKKI